MDREASCTTWWADFGEWERGPRGRKARGLQGSHVAVAPSPARGVHRGEGWVCPEMKGERWVT